ncbi:MAG: glycoside hydrolase family 88 protein [Clostridia bacterium]|nr:glycoside hydrolase family 88 protein [Clostridia bacterium]
MPDRYEEALRGIAEKYRRTAEKAAEAGIIPYRSAEGKWITSPYDGNSWWTGGFWPGLMWQLWHLTGDGFFREEARRVEKLLTDEFRSFRKLNHDTGFMYLLSCGADAKLTGDEQAETDLLHAASLLMGRFNPAGFIRAWNEPERTGYAIIDCMMNLALLYRASRDTGDPRFRGVAAVHADTTLKEFLREDGSVSHIIEFDPETGKRIREHAGQGYALGTQWSRGQAWGLYGFALAYRHLKDGKYLQAALKIAGNFTAHIREDGLTDCDFLQPAGEERLDNIAGAIAACGLQELAALTGEEAWKRHAEKLVNGLLDRCADWGGDRCGILTHCTASYHDDGAGRHTNIVYGDYFLAEALMKLCGKDPELWS